MNIINLIFDVYQDLNITNAKESNWTLNSYIVSASINKSHVSNLTDPVVVTLSHLTAKQVPHYSVASQLVRNMVLNMTHSLIYLFYSQKTRCNVCFGISKRTVSRAVY